MKKIEFIADQQKKILEHDDILADALVCTC